MRNVRVAASSDFKSSAKIAPRRESELNYTVIKRASITIFIHLDLNFILSINTVQLNRIIQPRVILEDWL